ncbi:tol-pal system-associated acyl-CoA thioesterase [Pseudoxanthomonas wuyuanensis]|uniref:Acyl-CoA thioester hydrolase n=1 Tax=Pseudoxanthomonas wuyuanensis TaxID=1073196 RepID=A0A286D4L3_9GAMM|nr:tol-pal system-associated acyl-CoA thioesterase [Pseudoxanthomonas wuyuanensis]KAF1719770.1 tol-pal system-associated acyl-CoA thioesterase [Pseudoxanthomonas wuyuanensis]SOD53585.1 acyl-CoA thioester hydrolase [Pseudoxanthomonas wuyuanensis]
MTSDSPFPIPGSRLFSWPTRIYWEDTDAGGVVYHAQYVAFLERARTEWLRAHDQSQERLRRDHDLLFAVRAMELDFLRPARLDDLLQVTVEVRQCKRASVVFAQSIRRGEEVLLTAAVRVAALTASGFKPQALPDALYQAFKSLELPPGTTDTDNPKTLRNNG